MSTSYLHTITFSSYKIKRKIDLLDSNFLLYMKRVSIHPSGLTFLTRNKNCFGGEFAK